MADLIKKIKIKKQDGTFTDYIPIGAEAQNISTNDGDSVQLKLNKKPYYYDTVADMKADTKLKVGDMAVTLGYYNVNDGGNAEYKIVSSSTSNYKHYETLANNLKAELIVGMELNIKQMGAYGDKTHDDTSIIRTALAYIYRAEPQTGWRNCRTIYFPHGKYLISGSLVDTNLSIYGGTFKLKGDGQFSSYIVCSESVDTIFDDNQIFGFTTFEDLTFSGYQHQSIFMNFVGGGTGNAQSLRFNKCNFNSFKTIIETSGDSMCSEVTFFECKISSCGSDSNPCDLFILNNSQGVNWRFYSTDIESFIGKCFNLKRGTSLYWYQGSCIPLKDSVIINATNAQYDYFGASNAPSISFHGVRFEMRGGSQLYNKEGGSDANLRMHFESCGMGGWNIPADTTVKTLSLGVGGSRIYFNNCYNMKYYTVKTNTVTGKYTASADIIEFNHCDIDIQELIENSDFSWTGNSTGYLVQLKVDGLNYRPVPGTQQFIKNMSYKNQMLLSTGDFGGNMLRNATVGSSITRTYYINNYVKDIQLQGISKAAYGSTATYTCTFYDENDNLLGTITNPLQHDDDDVISVNKYINTLKMVSTSDYSGSVAVMKVIILSVDRL